MKTIILRAWYKFVKKNPATMPMVKYWKTSESKPAKVTTGKDGSLIMQIEGEDQPFPGFPRGYLLYGKLSKLKHEIKNQVFNESWQKLEQGMAEKQIIGDIKRTLLKDITEIATGMKYDMVPPERMTMSVKEIYRAWTKVAPEKTYPIRDYLCFILQEDDGYRFRMQWLVNYFNPSTILGRFIDPVKAFEKALSFMEHGEVIGDMKERMRLLARILTLTLKDPTIKDLFIKLSREVDWNKVKLSKADKYHFRGKYFKVDLDVLDY